MAKPAIQVKDLSYAYGKLEAVRGISFEVSSGEVLGFLGPNGAGKSTTIKVLTGLLGAGSGTVRILGMDVTQDDPEIQARIGVCFEEKNLYLNMSGRENLKFFATLFGIKDPDVDTLLSKVGLADRARDRVSSYSKGMRQRLMMARALVNRPDVLFLDEPTDGLDPVSSQAIRGIIQEEAQRGAAVLLTTHDMWEADELSDRVAFINEGKLYALDTPENLKLQYGKRSVKVRFRVGGEGAKGDKGGEGGEGGDADENSDRGEVREKIVELDKEDTGEQLKAAVGSAGLMTIHTEEATLESIFIQMTGRGLQG